MPSADEVAGDGGAAALRRLSSTGSALNEVRSAVLEQVVELGSDPEVLERALKETMKEEAALKQQVQRALEESLTAAEAGDEGETGRVAASRRAALRAALSSLNNAIPTLQAVYKGASRLDERITETREMADVVSRRVREIDLARSRALLALGKVKRVMDLRACLKGVKESMAKGELEAASEHVFRFRQSEGAAAAGASLAEPDTQDGKADAELRACEDELGAAVLDALNRAIAARDDDMVLKGCRIFAKLGKAREGVSRLLQYRCEQLRKDVLIEVELTAAQSSPSFSRPEYGAEEEDADGVGQSKSFLDLLVYLINQGAGMIQHTSAVVRRSISPDLALQGLVVSSIHSECDKLITRILRMFSETHKLEERVRLIRGRPERLAEVMALGSQSWTAADDGPAEALFALDTLLDDLALTLKHTETYNHFIQSRHAEAQAAAGGEGEAAPSFKAEYINVVHELAGCYAVLEEAYMSAALATAFEQEVPLEHLCSAADAQVVGDNAAEEDLRTKQVTVSSIAEDSFYVIGKCIDRAKTTNHVDSTCAVVNNTVRALEDRLVAELARRVQSIREDAQSLSAQGQEQLDRLRGLAISQAQALSSTASPSRSKRGGGFGEDGSGGAAAGSSNADTLAEPETVLNSTALCARNTDKLRADLESFAEALPDERHRVMLKNCADGLLETSEAFRRTCGTGLDRLVNLVKPRLRDQMDSSLGSPAVVFDVTADEYHSHAAGADPYVWALLQLADEVISRTNEHLDLGNAAQIGLRVAAFVARGVEHAVVRKSFSPFGALMLDKQLRDIVKFFDARFGGPCRVHFRRLEQISGLLNLDRVEDVHDVYSEVSNGLAAREVKRVLALRGDFKSDDIKRLRI